MNPANKNIEIGEITSIRGLIATVVVFSEQKPKAKDVLILSGKDREVLLEVQSYADESTALCVVLKGEDSIRKRDKVVSTGATISIPIGKDVMGRMFNALGEPIDEKPPIEGGDRIGVYEESSFVSDDITRISSGDILETGIKVVDFFTPFVKGAKIGIAGGAGVGKTVLISSIIKNAAKEGKALPMFTGIGERIHEGQEMHEALDKSGLLKDAVLFMGQMNESASRRVLVGDSSAALAQYFRDAEKRDVLFFVDNIYRYVQAGNELSTMMRQIPSEGGYQPTLFSDMKRLQERLRSSEHGSITSVQTIYIPADDITDPAVQEIQQLLDSVIVLSRKKADQNIYPAVDLINTRSAMITPRVVGDRHYNLVVEVQSLIQDYESLKTIVSIIGEHELSQKDLAKYKKAKELIIYFMQNLYSSGELLSEDIKRFTRDETLKGVEEILKRDY